MNILAMQGSNHRGGNTALLLDAFLDGASAAGHVCQRLDINAQNIKPCLGCNFCRPQGKASGICVQKDDMPYEPLLKCDLLILASPVFWWGVTAQLKAFIDRMYAQPFRIWRGKKVKLIFTLNQAVPSMMAKTQEQIWTFMSSYMKLEFLGVLEASTGRQPVSQQPEILAQARSEGMLL
jgi:multimeric flavodoxin WrbA